VHAFLHAQKMQRRMQEASKTKAPTSTMSTDFLNLYGTLSSEGQPIEAVVTTHTDVDAFAISIDGIPFTEKAAAAAAEQAGVPPKVAQAHLYTHQVKPMSTDQLKARQQRAATLAYEHAGIQVPDHPKLPKNPLFAKYDPKFSSIPKALQNTTIKGQERTSIEQIAKTTIEFSEQLLHLTHVERSNDTHQKETFQLELNSTADDDKKIAMLEAELNRVENRSLHAQAQLVQAVVTYSAIPMDLMKIKAARSGAQIDGLTNHQYDADFYSAALNAKYTPGFLQADPYDKKKATKQTKTEVSKRHQSQAGFGARNTANSDSDSDDATDVPDRNRQRRGSRGKGGKGGHPGKSGAVKHRAASSDPPSAKPAAKPAGKAKAAPTAKAEGAKQGHADSNRKRKDANASKPKKDKRRKSDAKGPDS
jgi:hypothetical protein